MPNKKPQRMKQQITATQRTLEIGLKLNKLYEIGLQMKTNARTELTQEDLTKKLQTHIKKNGETPLQRSKPAEVQEHLQIQTKTTNKGQAQYKLSGVEKVILAALACLELGGAPAIKTSLKGELTVTISVEIVQEQIETQTKAKTQTQGKLRAKQATTIKPIKTPKHAPLPIKLIPVKAAMKRKGAKKATQKRTTAKRTGGAAA